MANHFKENQLITIYKDWENEKEVIGTGRLIKFKKKGLPFILKDTDIIKQPNTLSFHGQVITEWEEKEINLSVYRIYNYERWDVKIIKSQIPFYKIGNTYSLNIRYFVDSATDKEYFKIINENEDLTEEQEEEKYISECISKNLPIDRFLTYGGIQIY